MGFEEPYRRKSAAKIGRNFVIDFLILLFMFIVGFFMMQFLGYQFAKKNIHKYEEVKWVHMWLDMTMKKGAEIRFF